MKNQTPFADSDVEKTFIIKNTPQLQIHRCAKQHYILDTCVSVLQLPEHPTSPGLSHTKSHLSNTVPLLTVDLEV